MSEKKLKAYFIGYLLNGSINGDNVLIIAGEYRRYDESSKSLTIPSIDDDVFDALVNWFEIWLQ